MITALSRILHLRSVVPPPKPKLFISGNSLGTYAWRLVDERGNLIAKSEGTYRSARSAALAARRARGLMVNAEIITK